MEMLNPTALRKAKIAYNFGLSECNRVQAGKASPQQPLNLKSWHFAEMFFYWVKLWKDMFFFQISPEHGLQWEF